MPAISGTRKRRDVGAAAVASATGGSSRPARQEADVDWPTVNGTLNGQRYSPLKQIDTSNVKDIKVAWRLRTKIVGAESYPVVVGRTAYVTTTFGNVYALDAATGKNPWSFNAITLKNGTVGGLDGARLCTAFPIAASRSVEAASTA